MSSCGLPCTTAGPDVASIHLLPTLWFRNTWSWEKDAERPLLSVAGEGVIVARHAELGRLELVCDGDPTLLFTENESNNQRLFGGENQSPCVKDAFHDYVIAGRRDAVSTARSGTKAAAHYVLEVPAHGERTVQLRLSPRLAPASGAEFDRVFADRLREADEFYDRITPDVLGEDEHRVIRQALAGMLWSKQYYYFDLDRWLSEHDSNPVRGAFSRRSRNVDWFHMLNSHIISMPDKWEYPWYAAWDLAFHTLALSMVDVEFAKEQLELMLREVYLHPSGQIPAYEWNFGDVNPPVHAWATLFVYSVDRGKNGRGDLDFLRRSFQMLLFNFNWWLNRKDPTGQQRLHRRIPRPRQHRRLRPQRAAADRRAPRAGRRHRVDGLLLPEHARDRPRARQRRPGITRTSRTSSPSISCGSRTRWTASAITRTRCGTRPTASITTCSGCRTGAPGASRCARWWDCCRSAPQQSSLRTWRSASRS